MKTLIKNLVSLPVLLAGLFLLLAGPVTAQTFTILHSFTGITDSDGAYPDAGLALSGSTLYGTARTGGTSDNGTVFKVDTDGAGFTNLYSSTATYAPLYTNSDGAYPYNSRLILSGNVLYGTASGGGNSRNGTVFKVNMDGTSFTTLHSFTATSGTLDPSGNLFTNSDGAIPEAGLILSNNTLYGTADFGGRSGNGTVFKVNTDGTGFTILHNFTATYSCQSIKRNQQRRS